MSAIVAQTRRPWKVVAMVAVFTLLVAGCATVRHGAGAAHDGQHPFDHSAEGAVVARHLQERYDDQKADCRESASDPRPLPAVLCSGILLRTTTRGVGYDVWNPNPQNPQPNGVSFSWLRRDHAMSRLAWSLVNGYIVLPYFYADSPSDGYTQLTVLCAYPVDGATDHRDSPEKDGCGPHRQYANTGPCQAQGIVSAQQWLERFGGGALYGNQCSFTIKPGTSGASQVFAQLTGIRTTLGSRAFNIHNEVMIGVWPSGSPIPLEAFFYLEGTAGLAQAKLNQQDFLARMNRWVPVIRIRMPTLQHGPATFSFHPADQQIP